MRNFVLFLCNLLDLSTGRPVQVKVERQLQQTTLDVNGKNVTQNVVMKFVDRYFRQPWNQGGNLGRPYN